VKSDAPGSDLPTSLTGHVIAVPDFPRVSRTHATRLNPYLLTHGTPPCPDSACFSYKPLWVSILESYQMSATATRPTASLTVTPTQNTAPVLDFRCLYTFDLRRKQKRWQDGLARFHTFNKRVMVYDEPRNFIGDTHWREAEPIQDGDELQLDKGVLIQVGEPTGKMDQDISGLFEKRRAKEMESEGSSPARAPVTQTAPSSMAKGSTTAPSQLRPKTLNALLGTPKGRIGRATLPEKSPFEVRRASGAENDIVERPTKRQRIMTPSEKVSTSNHIPTPNSPQDPKPARSNHAIHNSPKPTKRQLPQATEKATPPVAKHGGRKDLPAQGVEKGKARVRKSTAEASRPHRSPDRAKRSPHQLPKQPQSRQRASPEVIIVDSDDKADASDEPAPQGARLRIATSKPRKKLMYKDLLPPVQPAQQATDRPPDASITRKKEGSLPRTPKTSKERAAESQEGPLSQYHREQRIRLRQRLKKHDQKARQTNHAVEQPLSDEPQPLFISDDELPAPLPDHPGPSTHPGSPQPTPDSPSPAPSPHSPHQAPSSSPPPTQNANLKPPAPPKPPNNPLTTLPPSLPPAKPPSPSHSHSKPSQRSHSAVTPSKANQKRTLRKTVSDTSTLGAIPPKAITGAGIRGEGEAAPDAWSREAWDLFGFGREVFC